jgi:hypothetical protein
MLQDCNPWITLYKIANERLWLQWDALRLLLEAARMVISLQMQLVILSSANKR